MDLFEAIKKRASVRNLKNDVDVDDATINKILEAAIQAPSAGNGQSWRFFVIRNKDIKHRLALEAGHQKFIDDAPVLIVVASDLEKAGERYGDRGSKTYALQETAAATENMMLAATALGFASCWIGAFNESVAAEILGLPKNIRPLAMLPIGAAAVVATKPPRKKLEEVVKFV